MSIVMDLLIELWLKIIQDADYNTAINLSSASCTIYIASNKIRSYHFNKQMIMLCNSSVTLHTRFIALYTKISKYDLIGSWVYFGTRIPECSKIQLTAENIFDYGYIRHIVINEYCTWIQIMRTGYNDYIRIRSDSDKLKGKLKLDYDFGIDTHNIFYTDNFIACSEKIIVERYLIT